MHRGFPWVGAMSAESVDVALGLLPHEDLLVFLDDLLELMIVGDHDLRQLILYIHAMMMQHLAFRQQQLLN